MTPPQQSNVFYSIASTTTKRMLTRLIMFKNVELHFIRKGDASTNTRVAAPYSHVRTKMFRIGYLSRQDAETDQNIHATIVACRPEAGGDMKK